MNLNKLYRLAEKGVPQKVIAKKLGTTEWQVRKALGRSLGRQVNRSVDSDIQISGIKASDSIDYETLWEEAERKADEARCRKAKRLNQTVRIPVGHGPIAITYLSDIHFGGKEVAYNVVKRDAETVGKTEGMYAIYHGDGIDNYITPKLLGEQRDQGFAFDASLGLYRSWLRMLQDKLLVVVSGNHDNWTYKQSGIDWVAEALSGAKCLYDQHEVLFTLALEDWEHSFAVRHKWKGNSANNPTWGIESGMRQMPNMPTFGIGGHTHYGTVFRSFVYQGKLRQAILMGTYKMHDSFGKEVGYQDTLGNGSGTTIFLPDGRWMNVDDVALAAEILKSLRAKW